MAIFPVIKSKYLTPNSTEHFVRQSVGFKKVQYTVCILMPVLEITKEALGSKATPTRCWLGPWWSVRTAASNQWRLNESSPSTGWTDPNSEPPLGLSLMIIHLLHNQTLQLSWAHTHTLWSDGALPSTASSSTGCCPELLLSATCCSLVCQPAVPSDTLNPWHGASAATGRLPRAHVSAEDNSIRHRRPEGRRPLTCPYI